MLEDRFFTQILIVEDQGFLIPLLLDDETLACFFHSAAWSWSLFPGTVIVQLGTEHLFAHHDALDQCVIDCF